MNQYRQCQKLAFYEIQDYVITDYKGTLYNHIPKSIMYSSDDVTVHWQNIVQEFDITKVCWGYIQNFTDHFNILNKLLYS